MDSDKKKTKKANPFFLFLLEFRRTEREKGNDMDMNEAQFKAGQVWEVSVIYFIST